MQDYGDLNARLEALLIRQVQSIFFNVAAPDMAGVSIEQFMAMSTWQPRRVHGQRGFVLPDVRVMKDRYEYEITGSRVKDLRRLRKRRHNVESLLRIVYFPADGGPEQLAGVLGVQGSAEPLLDIANRLWAAGVPAEVSTPDDPPPEDSSWFTIIPSDSLGYVLTCPMGGEWRDAISNGRASTPGGLPEPGAPKLLKKGSNKYLLLTSMKNPAASTSWELSEPVSDDSAWQIGIDALSRFFGAYLATQWLSNNSGLDIWEEFTHNRPLRSWVLSYMVNFSREADLMAESEPTSADIVASVVEQIQRVKDPLGRIVIMDELADSLMDAVYEQGMEAAAEFRKPADEGGPGGTWVEIAKTLGVTPTAAQIRLDPKARARNAEKARRRRQAG